MKVWKVMLVIIAGLALGSTRLCAQSYDLQLVQAFKSSSLFDVKLQIKAATTPFTLGTSNFAFLFDTTTFRNPQLLMKNHFSSGKYDSITMTISPPNRVSVNVILLTADNADTVKGDTITIATVRFAVRRNATSMLTWDTTSGAPTVVWNGSETTKLTGRNFTGLSVTTGIEIADPASGTIPTDYALDQNFPNPFNPSTMIQFSLPKETRVTLEVFNLLGQRVGTLVDQTLPAGIHTVHFDGGQLASGVYFYRLSAESRSFMKKMMILK